ncbi:MAG: phosphoenolpyruvate synthase [Promethearchaeia archaeon]
MKDYRYIKFFEELRSKDVNSVGGKNASLGELMSFGIPVPLGFAVLANAFDYVLETNDILYKGEVISLKDYIQKQIKRISRQLNREDIKSIQVVDKICANIRTHIEQARMPDILREEILEAYEELTKKIGKETTFAIRSSATAEDLPDASFAGQQDTHLNISGKQEVLEYILKDMASVFTTRATAYRERAGFDHFEVKLSVGVQEMAGGVNGVKCSGVMFTEDPDSGNPNVLVIRGTWGLGELIVQGAEKGDEYIVFKHNPKGLQIINRSRIRKEKMMVFDRDEGGVDVLSVPEEKQMELSLSDEQVLELAEYAIKIREHYGRRMDIEWAIDNSEDVYIVQARPETVHSQKGDKEEIFYLLEDPDQLIKEGYYIENSGTAIGRRIGDGKLKIIESINQAHLLEEGDILVTEETNPDWTSYMQNLGGVITERGGPTCHAAIVSRELNIASIVGADNIVDTLDHRQRQDALDYLTIDCSEGEPRIWTKKVKYDFDTIEFDQLPETKTQVLVNLGIPKGALSAGKHPDGTGLARLEFIINDEIQIHPNALINFEKLKDRLKQLIEQRMKIENIKKSQLYYKDPFNQEIHKLRETINEIEKITVGFKDKKKFYVQKLAEGIATIAAGVWKELKDGSIAPCIVRLSDFKTNEYRNLLGGWYYESDEHNPMLGFRGASRYVSNEFQDAFVLELEAIKLARQWGLKNIIPMIPFCRTPEEADKIEKIMKRNGLTKGENGLKVYCMAEIPSNIFLADVFCNYFDGFSIGSNDLTQLVYGSGRDNEKLIPIAQQFNYITNSGAIRRAVKQLIKIAHEHGKKVGICGQAPSDDPEFLRFLVREKIDSISLNFDTFARGKINTWRTETIEHRLEESQKDISYKFLREADELVSQIRGKLKTLDLDDDVNKKKYNDLSTQIVEMADNFVETIEEGSLEDFDSFYYKFVERLEKYRREIDNI